MAALWTSLKMLRELFVSSESAFGSFRLWINVIFSPCCIFAKCRLYFSFQKLKEIGPTRSATTSKKKETSMTYFWLAVHWSLHYAFRPNYGNLCRLVALSGVPLVGSGNQWWQGIPLQAQVWLLSIANFIQFSGLWFVPPRGSSLWEGGLKPEGLNHFAIVHRRWSTTISGETDFSILSLFRVPTLEIMTLRDATGYWKDLSETFLFFLKQKLHQSVRKCP